MSRTSARKVSLDSSDKVDGENGWNLKDAGVKIRGEQSFDAPSTWVVPTKDGRIKGFVAGNSVRTHVSACVRS